VPDEVRLHEENDSIPIGDWTDRYYTQGLKFEAFWHDLGPDASFLPGISHAQWCSLICGKGAKTARVEAGFAIGQNMYTPERIEIARPQPYDLPWAGHLYASRVARIGYEEPSLRARRQDRIDITVGVVGPVAFAKQTQIFWHDKVTPAPRPNGWDNQLKNEPVLQLRYETTLRWPRREGGKIDFTSRVRANVGNALVALEGEITGRVGWNLSRLGGGSNGVSPPILLGEERTATRKWPRLLTTGSFFVRTGMQAVAHNIILQGNTFTDNDIRIRKKPFVPERAAGVELNLIGDFWVTAQRVRRGSEFKTLRGRHAPDHEFTAVTLAWIKR
jgi:hypothetical protein